MQSASENRYGHVGYQGYPYVNPMVTDVPSIDAETAARWANLPRRPAMDLPGPGVNRIGTCTTIRVKVNSAQRPKTPVSPKEDIDDNPVVYIDIPEAGSPVSRSIVSEEREPEFVQNTIMYDPFENRRIDIRKDEGAGSSSEPDSGHSSMTNSSRPYQNRPNTLNIGAGSSSQSTSNCQQSAIPSFMMKESQVYGSDGSDGFPMSPIPISEFPEPPPAYSEVAEAPVVVEPVAELSRVEPTPAPRTQVIINESFTPVIAQTTNNFGQKNLNCHHCGRRVYTLLKREPGLITHFMACLVLFIFIPLVLFIYYTQTCKYKNHYCPYCKKKIGYERPYMDNYMKYVP